MFGRLRKRPIDWLWRLLPSAAIGLALTTQAVIGLALTMHAVQAAPEPPDAFIERVSSDVLKRIENDPDIRAGELAKVSEFVDQSVMPYINFERMTASAVGRYWRGASPEQRQRLMTEFRDLLLRTYAGALSEARGTRLRLKPMRADPSDPEVIVRSELILPGREPIQLDYRLEKNGDGWKIFDLNVLGLWLVDNYRTQFSSIIGSSGIDGLIRTLSEKNRDSSRSSRS